MYIIDDIEIFSDSDRKNSDEENSDEKIQMKKIKNKRTDKTFFHNVFFLYTKISNSYY